MNTVNNRRKQDNRRLLIRTILRLLELYDFDSISIAHLCNAARLHRSTFYAHFRNITDLLMQISDYIIEEIEEEYRAHPEICVPEEMIRIYLSHVKERYHFFRVLASPTVVRPSGSFRPLFILDRIIVPYYLSGDLSEEYRTTFIQYFYGGIVALMRYWLDHNCDTDPALLASMIIDFIPASLKQAAI